MEACSIVNKSTLHLVGIPYCGPYSSFPDEAIRLQSDFLARRHELNHVIQPSVMYCPYFGNEAFATYWACFEKEYSDEQLPQGMVAITIPPHRYAVVSSTSQRIGEGYELLNNWILENGYHKLENAVSLEIFYLEGQHWEEEAVDLLIPIAE
ncbi:effector binding domain-containing protein [Paenibacillus septentrionalis]|uniref:Effector binding domain-containing protein n=1 Tax=Paenibacillus septentrionalis TaxID=429342 RepID=A0ABW1UYV9_9BACL